MDNEEKYLNSKIGQKNPFKTPEGYFDQFTEQMMKQLPGQEEVKKPAIIRRLRPWLYAAACIALLVISVNVLYNKNQPTDNNPQMAMVQQSEVKTETPTETYSDSYDAYIEDAANYAMIDNEEIYAYLADL